MQDRVFTGDTLMIRGTGRTDFQDRDPGAQYELLFGRLLRLPDEILVFPAHGYSYRGDTVRRRVAPSQANIWSMARPTVVPRSLRVADRCRGAATSWCKRLQCDGDSGCCRTMARCPAVPPHGDAVS